MNKWIMTIVRMLIQNSSPQIIESIRTMIQELVVKAAETENDWDDILAWLLQMLVGKPGDPVK